MLGQDRRATPAQASGEYSRLIAEVAESHDVAYLPLTTDHIHQNVRRATQIAEVIDKSMVRGAVDATD